MKKLISSFVVIAMLATSVFAIDLSVGGNLDFTHMWNVEKLSGTPLGAMDGKTTTSYNLIGVNAFFDAQYVRVMFGPGFTVGGATYKTKSDSINENDTDTKVSGVQLNLAILGKYPFEVGIAKIFPMAGFEFSFNVSAKYDGEQLRDDLDDDTKKDLNHYFFVAGLGSDITVGSNMFITPTFLFGVDMKKPSGYSDAKEGWDAAGAKYSNNTFMFNVGLGFGYRL